MIQCKRGDSEVLMPIIISVLVMLFFFGSIFIGASRVAKGVVFYEKAYTEQVVLLIENSLPDSEIILDFSRGFELAKEQKRNLNRVVLIDNDNNVVSVQLGNRGRYSMHFFNDYNVNAVPMPDKGKLKLVISK